MEYSFDHKLIQLRRVDLGIDDHWRDVSDCRDIGYEEPLRSPGRVRNAGKRRVWHGEWFMLQVKRQRRAR